MVEVLIGNESMVLTSKKTIDKDLVKALKNKKFNELYDKRIAAWMKDYNTTYDLNHGTLEFSRKYREEDINPNGLESTMAKLEHDHIDFIHFLYDLIREYNQRHDPEPGETTEEKNDDNKSELHMVHTKEGVHVYGNMSPFLALAIIMAHIETCYSENDEKGDQAE